MQPLLVGRVGVCRADGGPFFLSISLVCFFLWGIAYRSSGFWGDGVGEAGGRRAEGAAHISRDDGETGGAAWVRGYWRRERAARAGRLMGVRWVFGFMPGSDGGMTVAVGALVDARWVCGGCGVLRLR